ncbi:hypothetical protein [Pseudoalteromonas holothuriae]|nr:MULTISPECIES: hypothetical protein [unclassified Pseudoalteromonas]
MNPLYAEILDITPLRLNAQFRPSSRTVDTPSQRHGEINNAHSISRHSILFSDINQAIEQAFSDIMIADTMCAHNGCLYLPADKLTSAQKRQLWALLSE